ncbi:MAG: prepilin-type N-terminal cleavage/methylation domain-containing protein [Aquificae bacterium]|nr:prepilin-type N-terminal cleavage/methylation domain-containing protein [Aquificota bacterium]
MVRKVKGFTLIEIVLVLAILAIIFAIAIPTFSTWRAKYYLEKDVRNLASFINMARNKAFTEKINLVLTINGNEACLSCKSTDAYCNSLYTGNIQCITFNYDMGSYTISISSRGTLTNTTIFPLNTITGAFGCIKLSTFRAKIGVINGTVCETR